MWPLAADSPYGTCIQLFQLTPAVETISETTSKIILMLGRGTNLRFYNLARHTDETDPWFVLSDWRSERVVYIHATSIAVECGVPSRDVDRFLGWALGGIPVPRDGSAFGVLGIGLRQRSMEAILAFRSNPAPQVPEATMGILIDADLTRSQRERVPCYWWSDLSADFWFMWQRKSIVDLREHFGLRPETAYWVDVRWNSIRGVIAVREDVTVGNTTLPEGRFAPVPALRRGVAVPTLPRLLEYSLSRRVDLYHNFAAGN
jgi:hypothetical protein